MAGERTETLRWRIEIVEQREESRALVRWRRFARTPAASAPPQGESSMEALLAALGRVTRRGEGARAWAPPLADDPIAFLLDSVRDAVNVWSPTGQLLYSNRAAATLELAWPGGPKLERVTSGGRVYERRCFPFTFWNARYLIEVISPGGAPP
jgi:hypothetical protein